MSECLKQEHLFRYLRIDTDGGGRHTFAANGFPPEWDSDPQGIDFARFVDELHRHNDSARSAGAVVSLPTTYRLTPEQLEKASQYGVTPIVLWGTEEHCIRATTKRIKGKGGTFNLPRYRARNGPTFEAYGRPEYAAFRVEAFRPDGSRWPQEEWLRQVLARTAG